MANRSFVENGSETFYSLKEAYFVRNCGKNRNEDADISNKNSGKVTVAVN